MSIREDIIEILSRISLYNNQQLCDILSLALDIPELFGISDKELFRKLRDYEGTQSYMEGADVYDEDEEY